MIPEWLERLQQEYTEVNTRTQKLEKFLKTDQFKSFEEYPRVMLSTQIGFMRAYRSVLMERLAYYSDLHTKSVDTEES